MQNAVLITGSTKGIGKATALQALEQGWFVYLNYAHDDSGAKDCEEELERKGYHGRYEIVKADVSCESGIQELAEQIQGEKHPLKALVLNASSNGKTRNAFLDITMDEMEEMFRINLFAPFFLTQKLAEKIQSGGAIVFVSSHVGIYPHSTYIPYGLTKSAEIFLAKMLVKEFSERKITVNAVAPAFIETNMFPGNRSQDHLESIRNKVAVHRFGQPEEVAKIIMDVVQSPYMNGNVISMDGGYNFK